jgi:hydroxymethylpyrimidine/phosphomethylpyrimidine kinase
LRGATLRRTSALALVAKWATVVRVSSIAPLASPVVPPVALTVAGVDPSGGAGIVADLKTFHTFQVYGAAVVTLLTVQNTRRVSRVVPIESTLVSEQIDAVFEDLPVAAWKTGALGRPDLIEVIADRAQRLRAPLVVDPVLVSKHGHALVTDDARAALVGALLPRAHVVTPNLHEAAVLTGRRVETLADARAAAQELCRLGARAALVKGGHLEGEPVDVLCGPDGLVELRSERIDTLHTHGTGCTYSAAIAARLAHGDLLEAACRAAKRWLTVALRTAPGLGGGIGPVNHLAPLAP